MVETKKEETKHKVQTKTVPAGVESDKLQAEGWIVTKSYKDPSNPLIRLYDLEQRNKD